MTTLASPGLAIVIMLAAGQVSAQTSPPDRPTEEQLAQDNKLFISLTIKPVVRIASAGFLTTIGRVIGAELVLDPSSLTRKMIARSPVPSPNTRRPVWSPSCASPRARPPKEGEV